ncbi:MAG: isochorismatase family cysteine hydrolase [Acidimicrobiia bacterium]
MAIDLPPLIAPATTAVVALEVQENLLLPESAMIPGLAAHAHSIGLVDRLAGLYDAARRVGAPVVYVTDERRRDGVGAPRTSMVARSITGERKHPGHGPIVKELTPRPTDVWLKREQGMTGFFSTPLDAYLRNLGVTTIVVTGVSANIAVLGTSIEAMNLDWMDELGLTDDFDDRVVVELAIEAGGIDPAKLNDDPMTQEYQRAARDALQRVAAALADREFFLEGQRRGISLGVIYAPEEVVTDPHLQRARLPRRDVARRSQSIDHVSGCADSLHRLTLAAPLGRAHHRPTRRPRRRGVERRLARSPSRGSFRSK